jgi:hypothetical protein
VHLHTQEAIVAQKNVSTTLQDHRRKLRLEGIAHHLDLLCEQHDSLAPGHADRPQLLREIERWNVEYQAED